MTDPHAGQPLRRQGADLAEAQAALVLLHGRGATADSMLPLADALDAGADVAVLAPQAARATWYPYSFLAPMEDNEPWLSSALRRVDAVVQQVLEAGVPAERLVLMGFSQGACLALEYAARHARRYGGVVGFSGGLIGPPGTPRDYAGAFEGTPVFLGCSDRDPHIPRARVDETAAVLERMGATVDARIYPNMGHTINRDELDAARALLRDATT